MKVSFSLLAAIVISISSVSAKAGMCDDPLRNQDLCLKMKSLRSQLDLLDEQRDLMQINYPLTQAIASDIQLTVTETTKSNPSSHLEALMALSQDASRVERLAQRQEGQSVALANKLKNQCMACHTEKNPASGFEWSKISANNWAKIVPHCNTESGNPYLCKSMNGMKTVYGYFLDSYNAGGNSFELAGAAAAELKRISDDLAAKEIHHGSAELMKEVSVTADELAQMAAAKKPDVFKKALGASQTCMKCHN